MRYFRKILHSTILAFGLSGQAFAVNIDDIKINGFFDVEYEKGDKDGGDRNGSFDQYHMNLLFEYPVNDRFVVRHHLEYEHVPALKPGGTTGGEIKTEWSYGEYLHSNALKIRAGFALTPFGLYNENHDATPTYNSMRTPWSIYKSTSTGAASDLFPKFSTGIFVLGAADAGDTELSYVVYLANGEGGSNEAKSDGNTNKAVGGRITATLSSGLVLGASLYSGKVSGTEAEHDAHIISIEYAPGPYAVRAEIAESELAPPGGTAVTQEGNYIEASYMVNSFTPFIRVGTHDPDDKTSNDEWGETVIGINYKALENVILKLENRSFDGDPGNADVSKDYNEWAAAITVAF